MPETGITYQEAIKEMETRRKTLERSDRRHRRILYSNLDTEEVTGEEMIPDTEAVSPCDNAEHALLLDQLRAVLETLPPEDRNFLTRLFWDEITEADLGDELGVSQQAISKRKQKIFAQIKKIMKI